MAIQKAYNCSLNGNAIDANEDNIITWSVSGDVQTAFQIDIYLNSDNSSAFSSGKITSYALKYTLPHASLTNGNEYKIKITLFNSSNQSITNDGNIFQTSSRPVVTVDPTGTVGSFSYNFTAEYSQAESVALRNFEANLYDSNKNLINTSGIQTTTPIQYLFSDLQTETNYYIEFQATSSTGLTGTSGLVSFSVFYLRPKMNVNLQSKNIDNAGVELSWYVSQIIGSTTGSRFINNDEIDTTDGTKVWFDSGFSISQDFSLKVWLRDFAHNTPLITLYGENGTIVLKFDAILQEFVLEKTINNQTDRFISNTNIDTSSSQYFISPYQVLNTSQNNLPVILIQQINKDMNIDVTMYS